jgi:hypothetical protein
MCIIGTAAIIMTTYEFHYNKLNLVTCIFECLFGVEDVR